MQAFTEREQVEEGPDLQQGRGSCSLTASGETGHVVDKKAESCYACHAARPAARPPVVPSRARTYRMPGRPPGAGMVAPIYNEPAAPRPAAHATPEAQNVLGVADVAISLREVDAETAGWPGRTAWLAAIAVSSSR